MRSLTALLIMAACIGGWLYANHVDYRDALDRDHRSWVARNCIQQRPNERGVIEVRHDGSTQCSRYENAGYGRSPVLVFAEVRE